MHEYTGDLSDPQRHCQTEVTDEDINNMTKTLLNESLEDCSTVGLNPFCVLNKPPAVSFYSSSPLNHICHLYRLFILIQFVAGRFTFLDQETTG